MRLPALGIETRFFSIWFSIWSKLPSWRFLGFYSFYFIFLASWEEITVRCMSQNVCKSRIISLQTNTGPHEFLNILSVSIIFYFLVSWECKCLLWEEYSPVAWCGGWSFSMCTVCSTEVTKNTSGGAAPGEAGAWCSEDPRFPSRSEDMVLDLIEQPTGVELESVFPDKIKRCQGRV